jgi:hypothetical protein
LRTHAGPLIVSETIVSIPTLLDRNYSFTYQKSHLYIRLPQDIWEKKYRIVTETYGFGPDSFEARTTPKDEAFWAMK